MTQTNPNPEPSPLSRPSQPGPSSHSAGRSGPTLADQAKQIGLLAEQCVNVRRFTGRRPTATIDMLLDTVSEFDDMLGEA